MRFKLLPYAVDGVLAGATQGQKVFVSILDECKSIAPEPSIFIIDFKGVDLATASFLRESVFLLKDLMRARNSNWYPVLANVCPVVEEELSILTQARRDALILCTCGDDEIVSDARLFSNLDPKHERTFEIVVIEGEADAGSLAETYGEAEQLFKPTAWNNRLKSLAERGVLMEFTKGRAKSYRPAW